MGKTVREDYCLAHIMNGIDVNCIPNDKTYAPASLQARMSCLSKMLLVLKKQIKLDKRSEH